MIYVISLIKASQKNVSWWNTQFCNQNYRKILKYLNVRWLSLEFTVDYLLKQYPSLKLYFLSEEVPTTGGKSEVGCLKWFKTLKKAFGDAMTRFLKYFYNVFLPVFTQPNLLQWEEPCISLLLEEFNKFVISVHLIMVNVNYP